MRLPSSFVYLPSLVAQAQDRRCCLLRIAQLVEVLDSVTLQSLALLRFCPRQRITSDRMEFYF